MELFGISISATETLIIEGSVYNSERVGVQLGYTAWLQVDGQNVGMLSYLVGGREKDRPTICDIEIREEFRGNKLGMRIIQLVEEHVIGEKLYTTGSYTPEGFKALSAAIPLHPYCGATGVKSSFRSMNFVADWERYEVIR